MSYMVVVTFDLQFPNMSKHGTYVYRKITDRLEELDFYKSRHGRSKQPFDLPSNTYLAEFSDEDYEKSGDLTEEISEGLKEIFRDLGVSGKFFVFAGKGWAWKGSPFKN